LTKLAKLSDNERVKTFTTGRAPYFQR
jgi:hypothetical protein